MLTHHATVTLTPLSSDAFQRRSFVLHADRDTISIGRCSKCEAKNLSPREDNGWFDSRVMSRDHAKLWASFQPKTINLIDNKSMHGTFVNGKLIPYNENTCLRNGDMVTFGSEVSRGADSFPPLKVRVDFQWCQNGESQAISPASSRPSNVFEVPDDDETDWAVSEPTMVANAPPPHITVAHSDSSSVASSDERSRHYSPTSSPIIDEDGAPVPISRVKEAANQLPDATPGGSTDPIVVDIRRLSEEAEAEEEVVSSGSQENPIIIDSDIQPTLTHAVTHATSIVQEHYSLPQLPSDSLPGSPRARARSASDADSESMQLSAQENDDSVDYDNAEQSPRRFNSMGLDYIARPADDSRSASPTSSFSEPYEPEYDIDSSESDDEAGADMSEYSQHGHLHGEKATEQAPYSMTSELVPPNTFPVMRIPSPSDKALAKPCRATEPAQIERSSMWTENTCFYNETNPTPAGVFSTGTTAYSTPNMFGYSVYQEQPYSVEADRASGSRGANFYPLEPIGSQHFAAEPVNAILPPARNLMSRPMGFFGEGTTAGQGDPNRLPYSLGEPPSDNNNNASTTRVSIADIVGEPIGQREDSTPRSGSKRKADDLEESQEENPKVESMGDSNNSKDSCTSSLQLQDAQPREVLCDLTSTSQMSEPIAQSAASNSPALKPETKAVTNHEPARKRVKTGRTGRTGNDSRLVSYAATAFAGMVVGGVGVLAALVSLPADYFA